MAADLNTLVSDFKAKALTLLAKCAGKGYEMRPYATLRDPFEQARLWRQSRSIEEITATLKRFETDGAPFLAHCIRSVGPQSGDHVTDAPPGLSWHQWGEALDCFWVVDGKAEWSNQRLVAGNNGYRIYANEAKALGITAGGLWANLKDWPHVQFRDAGSPLQVMSLKEIDVAMKQRFGP